MDILLLGSTGQIGTRAFEVINFLNSSSHNKNEFNIVGLSAGENISVLEEQIKSLKDYKNLRFVCVKKEIHLNELSKKYSEINFFYGDDGLKKIVDIYDYDLVLNALSGICGLIPTFIAANKGKKIAIANKESIIYGGEILKKVIKLNGSSIIPIDSEHSAIFQLLQNKNKNEIKRLILTASGGPFKNFSHDQLKNVSVSDALNHPVWKMGKKISIDSATMINKAFEIIEAYFLFDIDIKKIDAIIHPEGVIHSMVEFFDDSIMAQISTPDMRLPIQFALTYPKRVERNEGLFDFNKFSNLTFKELDNRVKNIIDFFKTAVKCGPLACCVLCSSDEEAVDAFLKERIKFLDIEKVIKLTYDRCNIKSINSVEEILEADLKIREISKKIINSII